MKKILIALDYDPVAERIAEKGYELGKAMNAEIILLHVVSEAFYYTSQNYSPIMGYEGFNNLNVLPAIDVEALRKAALDFLNSSKRHLGDENIQTIIKDGDFADSILEAANEVAANLIVMGSHGRRGLDRMLLGSVAEQVLHKTTIPLFIIPTKQFENH